MKHLILPIFLLAGSLTNPAAAANLDLFNAYSISENITVEKCLAIAEEAISKTGLQIFAHVEGGVFRGSSPNVAILAEVWCVQVALGVTQAISTVTFDSSSAASSNLAKSAFETIGSVVHPNFE